VPYLLSQRQSADCRASELSMLYIVFRLQATGYKLHSRWSSGSRIIVTPVHDGPCILTFEPLLADVEVTPTKIASSFGPLRRILLVGCALYTK
jgi:hypothetical protein